MDGVVMGAPEAQVGQLAGVVGVGLRFWRE